MMMNTSGTWSRRCSTETIFSLQGKETDIVRDTSDTDYLESDRDIEYEPVTDDEVFPNEGDDTTDESCNEIITTRIVAVSVGDDGELEFADSEQTEDDGSDSEMDLHDYWQCVQCRADNNNPLYRYCESCFKVRKNLFPPRPKRKHKRQPNIERDLVPRTFSQDSGVYSQETLSDRIGSASQNDLLAPVVHALTDDLIGDNLGKTVSKGVTLADNLGESVSKGIKLADNLGESVSKGIKLADNLGESVSKGIKLADNLGEYVSKGVTLADNLGESILKTESGVDTLDGVLVSKTEVRLGRALESENDLGIDVNAVNTNILNEKLDSVGKLLPGKVENDSVGTQTELVEVKSDTQKKSVNSYRKRRAESADRNNKRIKIDYSNTDSDSDSGRSSRNEIAPLTKTISDPTISIESTSDIKVTKKVISDSLKEKLDDGLCIICFSEPKSGVFVHGKIAHICCCYKCAVRVWTKARRCPVCNCKVSNVLKAVVM